MTVASATAKSGPYVGNGVNTSFAYGFRILDEEHLLVTQVVTATGVETVLDLTTDYTVNDVGSATGTIDTVVAPASTEEIVITRDMNFLQPVDLQNQGTYYPDTLEDALDRTVMQVQQVKEEVSRSVKVDVTSGDDPQAILDAIDASAAAASAAASAASTSETNAGTSETNAAASETAAGLSETAAAASETAAGLSETAAAASETAAGLSETAAELAETNAETAQTAAELAETNAATSETNAATSETNAAASYDSFAPKYLGAKASDPTLDNEGGALINGALYWNSTNDVMKSYSTTSSTWVDIGSGTVYVSDHTATAGQTTFTGSGDNAISVQYTPGYEIVTVNGATLQKADYTATTGSSVVLSEEAQIDDAVTVIGLGTFDVADLSGLPQVDNLVHNGDMSVFQRVNAIAGITGGSAYVIDRWSVACAGAVVMASGQVSTSGPFSDSAMSLAITTADASLTGTDYATILQGIEGSYFKRALFGTSNAKTLGLRFWVKSTVTGTYCVALYSSAGTRSYVREYTINAADTWEEKELTFPGDTSGTWATDSSGAAQLRFTIACGPTLQAPAADSWQAGNYVATSNQVNGVSSTSNVVYLSRVQLTVGATVPPWQDVDYADNLMKCQRYYAKSYNLDTAPGTVTDIGCHAWRCETTSWTLSRGFNVPMRAAPTMTYFSSATGNSGYFRNASRSVDAPTTSNTYIGENGFSVNGPAVAAADVILGHWVASAEI